MVYGYTENRAEQCVNSALAAASYRLLSERRTYSMLTPAQLLVSMSLGLVGGITRDRGRCFDPDTEIVGSESEMTMGHTF